MLLDRTTKDSIIKSLTAMSVLLILFVTVAMLTVIFIGGWRNMTWEFLTQFPREGMTRGGIFPAIIGTALMTMIMTVAAVPFGAITAVYL
jgi:phosphate transport system permease protein